ncbi:MAG TPA: hydantoinase B/oxoprolinase family protein [Solirubrobacteraceae bacterium]|nr:hydantoinase B/oxoprolinase family protein [Solirubrobacteraceae bacterium]
MAIAQATPESELGAPNIGWDGRSLQEMLTESERLFADTGHYYGLQELTLMASDPIGYEKLFSRLRGGLVSARETALNISASPIVRELGELCFALYTPEGDSLALSTGIIVHVHTMSDAIKWMVRQGYEDNPRIRPGDIFANNDPTIGDVHNADVQTFVPIFWEGELIAWAGGVTHVLDIGASTPGGVPVGPTMRYEDGIDLPCMKIGERDELAPWHLERCRKRTRASAYYMLDERTRLAGCHMVRQAVERVLLEEGPQRFKAFSREVIEEGRRSFKARIREMTVPGRYRSPAGFDAEFADKPELPARARRDVIMHSPFEVRIGGDGTYELDYDGCSAWGWHSMNCTPSGMQGAIWVMFTQTLICNDKVNDGAYFAIETNFPEGTISNLGDAEGSTAIAWAFLQPSFTGFPRTISRALQARGFIEEVLAAYSVSGNVQQGGGIDQYGNSSAIMNFEISAQGMGAKYVLDGTDYCAAMFNPEGDMGDIEMWELISPFVYLSRRVKASSGGPGRHRGGSSFESLFMVNKTPFWELQNIGTGRVLSSSGLFGGYPGATAYIHNIHGADLTERAMRGEAYPVADGDFESPALMEIQGSSREYKQDGMTMLSPFAAGDLYLSVMKGGAGLGDPLLRPVERIRTDVEEGHLLPRFAESVYGVSDRDAFRRRRLARAVPVREWVAAQRERILAQDLAEVVKVMYAESMRLSPRWAAEYRGFWDLPEDFEYDVLTPTVTAARSQVGKLDPDDAADAFLAASDPRPGEEPSRETGGTLDSQTLAGLLDERLTRREVKEIQSGYKDSDRFQKWIAVLQERVPYEDPIVLPAGEGLNIVRRRSDGQLVHRCDCGHDFCAHNRNWKMDAVVFVRETEQDLLEIYPKMAGPDPTLQQIREFYCPSCARQLEVEALQPGYPVVHEFLPDVEGFYRGWLGRELPR